MFAQVYPLVRLPRRFDFFDYSIPSGVELIVGDVVEIPFKGRLILGVVGSISSTSAFDRIASITRLVTHGLLDTADVARLTDIANLIGQSPSNLFVSALQGWQPWIEGPIKRPTPARSHAIDRAIAETVGEVLKDLNTKSDQHAQLSWEGLIALVSVLNKKCAHQVLVVLPRERDAYLVARDLGLENCVLTGTTKSSIRSNLITGWANGQVKILFGTRQASLLPAHELEAVAIFDIGSRDYHAERNPRFDPRLAAIRLAQDHAAAIVRIGYAPRVEEIIDSCRVVDLNQKDVAGNAPTKGGPMIIDLARQEERTTLPLISQTALNALAEALQTGQNVLISYNRKGVAKRLQCADCGYIPRCGVCGQIPSVIENGMRCGICQTELYLPDQCPKCRSPKLKQKGIGNEAIRKALAKHFPESMITLLDREHSSLPEHGVVIATEYFFKNIWRPFMPKQFGLVIELGLDLSMGGADVRSGEYALQQLHRLALLAQQQKAQCLIQTWLPDEVKLMLDPLKYVERELETRKAYKLPPAAVQYRIDGEKQEIHPEAMKTIPNSCIIEPELNSYGASSPQSAE